MRNADELFVIHEYWTPFPASKLKRLYLGRYVLSLDFYFHMDLKNYLAIANE